MDPDSYLNVPPITGLHLENYFPTKCTYDSVIYVHKKFLPEYKEKFKKRHEACDFKKTCDRGQQFDSEKVNKKTYNIRKIIKNNIENDPVVEQTIKFAETIIPLTIPPSDISPHTEYTIKAIHKPKRQSPNVKNQNCESVKDATYEKHKSRFDHFKREKLKRQRDSISAGETVSSSQNTLDDINENRTLSCTLSEISERKTHKEERHCKRNKRNEMQKFAVSESFEAVATEFMNTSSDTKIKIHLMNEKDKNLFCENIQTPVIGALKECITELNNENLKVLQSMQTSIDQQTKKMDEILSKLSNFEENFNFYSNGKASAKFSETSKTTKMSKLEELSADIRLVKETSSDEEELGQINLLNKSMKDGSVTVIKSIDKNILQRENKYEGNLGCGENIPTPMKAQLGIKPERTNRVPARFCWTDATKN